MAREINELNATNKLTKQTHNKKKLIKKINKNRKTYQDGLNHKEAHNKFLWIRSNKTEANFFLTNLKHAKNPKPKNDIQIQNNEST